MTGVEQIASQMRSLIKAITVVQLGCRLIAWWLCRPLSWILLDFHVYALWP